jgi:hypothetical protein
MLKSGNAATVDQLHNNNRMELFLTVCGIVQEL